MPTNSTPTPTAPAKQGIAVNVVLPPELHRQLKVKAATLEVTVKDAVVAALDAWVQT